MFAERRYDDTGPDPGADPDAPDRPAPSPPWLRAALALIRPGTIGPCPRPAKLAAETLLRGLEFERLPVPAVEVGVTSVTLHWRHDGRAVWFRIWEPAAPVLWITQGDGARPEDGKMHPRDFETARRLVRAVHPDSGRGFAPDVLDRLMGDGEGRTVR